MGEPQLGRRSPEPGNAAAVRVILIGRTGVDAALRKDPDIELYRVATPLEAVAELGAPIAGAAERSVVIVAPEVETALRAGPGNHTREFLNGLRIADPAVVVLGVARNGEAALTPFDGALSPDAAADVLRAAVRPWSAPAADEATPVAPAAKPRPTPAPPTRRGTPDNAPLLNGNGAYARDDSGTVDATTAPLTATPSPRASNAPLPFPAVDPAPALLTAAPANSAAPRYAPNDLALVTALIRNQDVLPTALAVIRARSGDATIDFAPLASQPQASAPTPAGAAPVMWEAITLGHLFSRRAAPGPLAEHAAWLAGWLRLRDQQAQLKMAAYTDPLTGAYNRRYFDSFLDSAIAQAQAARRMLTVMLFDIDDFKQYNDRYGHSAGDDILRETVTMMRSVIRPTDRVCRIGGDEFAVIFHEPQGPRVEGSRHPDSVFAIAQRFQQQVHEHKFPKLAGMLPGALTISGGLATFPWDGTTVAQLLARADELSLQSKRQGKNAITLGAGG